MRVLLDTNIIIDIALKRQPFYSASIHVLTLAYRREISAFISASTVSDIYYIVRKIRGHDVTLEFLRAICPHCQIATVDQGVILNALLSSSRDLEDAVQYETATANQLEAIVTRNPQDFVGDGLLILTPEVLIQQINSDFSSFK